PSQGAPGGLDAPAHVPAPEPRRRSHSRIVLAALIAVVAAAVAAAGLAFANTGPAPVGSGVVVIDTNLAYQGGEAAGTGMVLTSSGGGLTNNHRIRGAPPTKVVEPSPRRGYRPHGVGYAVAGDVAPLQPDGASHP